MKKLSLLFGVLLLLASACKVDDDEGGPIISEDIINYDGPNATGPLLAAGTHEMAVRFTTNELANFVGKQLTEVQFFVGVEPQTCRVKVYGKGSGNQPGALLYEANVKSELVSPDWNYHQLSTPIDIPSDELWLSIAFSQASQQQSIGCDAGPNRTNGDWLFSSSDGQWATYVARTSESVNWNIRGKVE